MMAAAELNEKSERFSARCGRCRWTARRPDAGGFQHGVAVVVDKQYLNERGHRILHISGVTKNQVETMFVL